MSLAPFINPSDDSRAMNHILSFISNNSTNQANSNNNSNSSSQGQGFTHSELIELDYYANQAPYFHGGISFEFNEKDAANSDAFDEFVRLNSDQCRFLKIPSRTFRKHQEHEFMCLKRDSGCLEESRNSKDRMSITDVEDIVKDFLDGGDIMTRQYGITEVEYLEDFLDVKNGVRKIGMKKMQMGEEWEMRKKRRV